MTTIICIAGFGDDASMFNPLLSASNTSTLQLRPVNLPGFGAPALADQKTTLRALADTLNTSALAHGAETVLAHSVSSIIASLAATHPDSPIKTILSLEGNLTPQDAYFSGSAANYPSPETFLPAFLARLNDMAETDPILARYRDRVKQADPKALWQLGCDAHAFSETTSPGAMLERAARSTYLYNPDNVPNESLDWLSRSKLSRIQLPGASHWASIDQPAQLAAAISNTLES